ncbi:HDOD domain-containing protein, partial [Pirellulales bacterium]|nr:HDOD domain-containing protein [Pirellulales bacterium]
CSDCASVAGPCRELRLSIPMPPFGRSDAFPRMTTASPPISAGPSLPRIIPETLDAFLRQSVQLYTLPAIAAEVLSLAEHDDVDAARLRECIERDPALTAKILRVVNSSVFGLRGQVRDLHQAVALLGVAPLKLLVLGFNLPDSLLAGVAREQLEVVWRAALIRAAAARQISEIWFQRPGADAFVVGLLQDIGVLALLNRAGKPYADLYHRVIEDGVDLAAAEFKAIGFHHRQLSAEMLSRWNMPEDLAIAISAERNGGRLTERDSNGSDLARILHLADMLAELVAFHRINVLPDLIASADAYCTMPKAALHALVGGLHDKVADFAEVLCLPGAASDDYRDLLVTAQQQMAALIEEGVEPNTGRCAAGDADSPALAKVTASLQDAISSLEEGEAPGDSSADVPLGQRTLEKPCLDRLTFALGGCRALRQPLSIAYLTVDGIAPFGPDLSEAIDRILNVVGRRVAVEDCDIQSLDATRRLFLLPGCERHEAVAVVDDLIAQLHTLIESLHKIQHLPACVPGAGVASVGMPAKNFSPLTLWETACRCLEATRPGGGVKSLEVC